MAEAAEAAEAGVGGRPQQAAAHKAASRSNAQTLLNLEQMELQKLLNTRTGLKAMMTMTLAYPPVETETWPGCRRRRRG